jgi:hypothetical protein
MRSEPNRKDRDRESRRVANQDPEPIGALAQQPQNADAMPQLQRGHQ